MPEREAVSTGRGGRPPRAGKAASHTGSLREGKAKEAPIADAWRASEPC
jgi:hypothetical protein